MTTPATVESPFVGEAARSFVTSGPKKLLIGGRWVEAASGATFEDLDPATGAVLAEVARGREEDVDRAVEAARRALEGPWGDLPPAERGRLLWKLADLIEEHSEELCQLESLDTGKPVTEAMMADVPLTADHFRYFAGWTTKLSGEVLPVSFPGKYLAYTRREPVGVVGAIVPWNFPLMIASWKVAPALAAGNTVILKPSELTPLSALRLGELALEAGLPAGVLNVVPGYGAEAGAALASHPGVDKVSFTGSTRVGKEILAGSTSNLKRVSLELGGKSPNIVFPDADPEAALGGALMGIFFNQGEVCCAGSRLYVHASAYDRMLDAMKRQAEAIQLGPGVDPGSQMGPLVSSAHRDRVLSYITQGKEEGARLVTGGDRVEGPGYFVRPTIFEGRDDLTLAREEVFGPVLVALPFEDVEEVVRRANDTRYGLAAAVWTQDMKKAFQVAHALKAGTVWINGYNLLDASSPWGGFKESGLGREMGSYALEQYTEVKSVWLNLT